jgi:16S rRNA (cytosine1402-N4)-methyltransferase
MDNETAIYHVPIMLHETVDALNIKEDGIYVDATFGGGGHSKYLLSKLGKNGKLFVFDQDADAQQNVPNDERVVFIHQNFSHLQRWLKWYNITEVDGIMADLGVSSHQFNEGERGFSIRFDGPLDMRMDRRTETKASDIIKNYNAAQLQEIFQIYGEVTNAKTLAQHLVALQHTDIKTIEQFKASLSSFVKGNPNRYFAQVFQALRIEVNKEMDAAKQLVLQAAQCLKIGGRLSILTFHSVEDRVIKLGVKDGYEDKENQHPLFNTPKTWPLKAVNKKPLEPSQDEQKINSRSRSAKLRIAEKIDLS